MTNTLQRLGLTAACAVLLLGAGACDRFKRERSHGEPAAAASASDTAAAEKVIAEAKADAAPAEAPATEPASAPAAEAPTEKK